MLCVVNVTLQPPIGHVLTSPSTTRTGFDFKRRLAFDPKASSDIDPTATLITETELFVVIVSESGWMPDKLAATDTGRVREIELFDTGTKAQSIENELW